MTNLQTIEVTSAKLFWN